MVNTEKFKIRWNYTNKMVNDLLKINKAKEIVDLLEIPISIEEEIKKETIVKRVYYSTKIEGNKLNLKEVKDVLENPKESRERNVLEVRNYYNALMYLNKESEYSNIITEKLIFEVYNLVTGKKITHKTNYRDGQNIVQDSISGTIVYMPSEANDVWYLMKQLIDLINSRELEDIPINHYMIKIDKFNSLVPCNISY